MSVVIRLARGGRKKLPYYSIVVANSRAARNGKFIEKVGTYDPKLPRDDAGRVKLVTDRIQHWLSVGAQPSDRVAMFLANAGMMKARVKRESTKQHLPKSKAQERLKEQQAAAEAAKEAEEQRKQQEADAKKAAEEAANAPAPEAAPEEAPAEEASAPAEAEAPANEEAAPSTEESAA